MNLIRLALFGYGNSANAVVKAIQMTKEGKEIGIWHKKVGGYKVEDIEVACAFDIDGSKFESKYGPEVHPGIAEDPKPAHIKDSELKTASVESIIDRLKSYKVDVAFNLISSGQFNSSKRYARLCAEAGVAFANGTSADVANDNSIAATFSERKIPLAGDDLMSQAGGTILHRGIVDFLTSRGLKVTRSYQLDVGGGTDTLNTIAEEVRAIKRKVKSQSIASELGGQMETVAGTTDFVDFLGSRRTVYLWLEAEAPLNEKYTMDIYYKSSDPSNAVNVILDVVRALMHDKRSGRAGLSNIVSAYGFKSPPQFMRAKEALSMFEEAYVSF